MTGGAGSKLDPVTLDSDDDDCTYSRRSKTAVFPEAEGGVCKRAGGKAWRTGDHSKAWISLDDECSIIEPFVKKEMKDDELVEVGPLEWSTKRPKHSGRCTTASVEDNRLISVKEEVKVEVKEEVQVEVKEEVKVEVKEEVKVEVKEEVKAEGSKLPTISLTPEQQQVLDLVREGKNVFFTGSGGTGKFFLFHQIFKVLENRIGEVAITAPTGMAATPIGGTIGQPYPLHRVVGFGIPYSRQDFLGMWKNETVREKWRKLSVLIIDEISMVSGEFLEYLEQMLRFIRVGTDHIYDPILQGKPFRGLQVIFAGDFFQLQPILEKQTFTSKDQFLNKGLAFEAPAWHKANLNTVVLKHVFRQEDGNFVDMLNGIRTGEKPAALQEIVKKCSRPLPVVDGILPTAIFSTNKAVDRHNYEKLHELSDEEVVLVAAEETVTYEERKSPEVQIQYIIDVQYRRLAEAEFWKECPAPKQISLSVGAQVMLLKNLEVEGDKNDLVNGSRGVLVGWKPRQELLKECHAISRRDDGKYFQATRMIEKLQCTKLDSIPIVKLRNGRYVNCVPELFDYKMLNVGECRRRQVPLKLAWALTIHKCQGKTLDYLEVNLKNIFAEGQVYVALSRARSIDGLRVVGTSSLRDVRVSAKVVRFYKALADKEVPSFSSTLVFPELNFDKVLDTWRSDILESWRSEILES